MQRWNAAVASAVALPALAWSLALAGGAGASAPSAPANCGTPSAPVLTQSTALPLDDGGVVLSTLSATGEGTIISDVDVTTHVRHTRSEDLDITLRSPAGTIVTLTTDNGGAHDDVFDGTRWDDDAQPAGTAPYTTALNTWGTSAGLADDHPYADGVTASPLAPEEALGAFIGEDPSGTWTLRVSDDAAGQTGTLDGWSVHLQTLGRAPALSGPTTMTNDTDVPISAAGNPTVTSTIAVSGAPSYLGDVDAVMDLAHEYTGDVQAVLTSPQGTSVTLASNPFDGTSGNFDDIFAGTTFNDDANPGGQVPYATNAGLATDHPYVSGVTVPTLAPTEGLAAFVGEDPNGIWTLTVADRSDSDGGTLRSWGLALRGAACLPESGTTPGTLAAAASPGDETVLTTIIGARDGDVTPPRSRPTRLRLARQPIMLRGTSSDAGGGRVTLVRVAVARLDGFLCRFLRADRTLSRRRECGKTSYLSATGTGTWQLRLPALPAGRYLIWTRAIDRSGNIERKDRRRNLLRLTVR